jgi:hypothetical protein
MRRLLSFSALALFLVSGIVGCDSFAGRKPDSEATTRSTDRGTRSTDRGTRSTNFTAATSRTVPTPR